MTTSAEEKALGYAAAAEYQTNHVLHLILTLITAGIWSGIWLSVAASNISKRNKIKIKAGIPTETNVPKIISWVIAIVFFLIIFALMPK